MQLTPQARAEQSKYNLLDDPEYCYYLQEYTRRYTERKPANNVPNRNMIKALRLHRWLNSSEDWARLHICEAFLRKQNKALKKSLLAGAKLQSY